MSTNKFSLQKNITHPYYQYFISHSSTFTTKKGNTEKYPTFPIYSQYFLLLYIQFECFPHFPSTDFLLTFVSIVFICFLFLIYVKMHYFLWMIQIKWLRFVIFISNKENWAETIIPKLRTLYVSLKHTVCVIAN